jgi:hypothetical protein
VKLSTVNRGVVAIVDKDSMNLELQHLSLDIFRLYKDNNISLEVQWVPREENAQADLLSRQIDCDDWGVSR